MCLAFPSKLVKLEQEQNRGVVDINGVKKEVNTMLLDDLTIGDYVLVHAGFAISKTSKEEATETLALFQELADASEDYLS